MQSTLNKAIGMLAIFMMVGCYYDIEEELYPNSFCDTETVTYITTIEPIIQGDCAIPGCHVTGNTFSLPVLSSYAQVKVKADDGSIRTQVVDTRVMPLNSSLTDCEIEQFRIWLDAGAPNN